jgi:hypothetical protein
LDGQFISRNEQIGFTEDGTDKFNASKKERLSSEYTDSKPKDHNVLRFNIDQYYESINLGYRDLKGMLFGILNTNIGIITHKLLREGLKEEIYSKAQENLASPDFMKILTDFIISKILPRMDLDTHVNFFAKKINPSDPQENFDYMYQIALQDIKSRAIQMVQALQSYGFKQELEKRFKKPKIYSDPVKTVMRPSLSDAMKRVPQFSGFVSTESKSHQNGASPLGDNIGDQKSMSKGKHNISESDISTDVLLNTADEISEEYETSNSENGINHLTNRRH